MLICFRRLFDILVLTIIKKIEVKSILGKSRIETQILGVASADNILQENDILVLYGANKDLQNFLKLKLR
jgi:trk system potassium uptake protein TrkA